MSCVCSTLFCRIWCAGIVVVAVVVGIIAFYLYRLGFILVYFIHFVTVFAIYVITVLPNMFIYVYYGIYDRIFNFGMFMLLLLLPVLLRVLFFIKVYSMLFTGILFCFNLFYFWAACVSVPVQ
jgi:hypothetical protein